MRSERSSQHDTRYEDDRIADGGGEQAGDHDETEPDQPSKNRAPPPGSIGRPVYARVQSATKPRSA